MLRCNLARRCCCIGLFNVRQFSMTIFVVFFLRSHLVARVAASHCDALKSRGPKEGLWMGAIVLMSQSAISKSIERNLTPKCAKRSKLTNILCYLARSTLEQKKTPRGIVKNAIFEANFPANERFTDAFILIRVLNYSRADRF